MNKKGAVQWIAIALFVLAFLFIFTNVFDNFKTKIQDGSLLTSIISTSTTKETTTTETIYNTQTITEKPNICNLLAPYYIPGDTANQCVLNGGTWRCDATFVGCSNLPFAIVDCSGTAVAVASYQCQQVGGNAVCNPTNLYCSY